MSDVLDLGWLPVAYNMELNLCKTVFKALNNEDWPPYLRLKVREQAEFKLNLVVSKHSGTFQQPTPRPLRLAQREPPSCANAGSFKYPWQI